MKDRLDDVDALIEKAVVLDRLYVPTRYPERLAGPYAGKDAISPPIRPKRSLWPASFGRPSRVGSMRIDG